MAHGSLFGSLFGGVKRVDRHGGLTIWRWVRIYRFRIYRIRIYRNRMYRIIRIRIYRIIRIYLIRTGAFGAGSQFHWQHLPRTYTRHN